MPAKTTQQPDDLNNPSGYSAMDWGAQLDPAYAAARAEVRRLSERIRRYGDLGVPWPPIWGRGAHAPCPRTRGDQGRVIRGHQSRGRPWGWGRL
jgi:hypothetical protein